jgi:hypothetical protein
MRHHCRPILSWISVFFPCYMPSILRVGAGFADSENLIPSDLT